MTRNCCPPIIIIGMHRSGTTMISEMLEQCGLFSGTKKDPNHEALFFHRLNDWLLHQCGATWDHPEPFKHLLENKEVRGMTGDHIRHMIQSLKTLEYLGWDRYVRYRGVRNLDAPWGWKDPRNTYTLPLWLDIFPRGKRSYDPLLCLEANSSFLWDADLRRGDSGTWTGSPELLASCFLAVPSDIRELRVRADAGFGYDPVLERLEQCQAQYAVVARMNASLKRVLGGLRYQRLNAQWEIADCEHRVSERAPVRRCVVARRLIAETELQLTLFTMERYAYRAWMTNSALTPAGVWHFYDGRAGMEPRIGELRDHFALRKVPTGAFDANALYLEIIRLAYNLVTAFQHACLPPEWQALTLRTGGRVDQDDGSLEICSLSKGMTFVEAQKILGGTFSPGESFAHWIAAIRELFEEAGILLAYDQQGNLFRTRSRDEQENFLNYREYLQKGKINLCEIAQREKLLLALNELYYYAHWITPEARSERFDTRFFLAQYPFGQEARHDQRETTAGIWITPRKALEENLKGEVVLSPPTLNPGAC